MKAVRCNFLEGVGAATASNPSLLFFLDPFVPFVTPFPASRRRLLIVVEVKLRAVPVWAAVELEWGSLRRVWQLQSWGNN